MKAGLIWSVSLLDRAIQHRAVTLTTSRGIQRCVISLAACLCASVAYAQVPRGESSQSAIGDEGMGALWIFAAVAVYAAFKESQRAGYQVLGGFALIGLIYLISPAIGSMLVGLLILVVAGMTLYFKFFSKR